MSHAIELWVEVDGRRALEAVRATGAAAMIVVARGGSPVFGRPGERLSVRLDSTAGPRRPAAAAVAALPISAGVIVDSNERGLAILAEARRHGRTPLAVSVDSADDVRVAAAAGATAVVATEGGSGLRDAARAAGLALIAEATSADAAEAALGAAVDGLLVPAAIVAPLLARPSIAASVAPSGPAVRNGPPAVGRAPADRQAARAVTGGGRPRSGTIAAALERAAAIGDQREALVHLAAGRRWTWASLRDDARTVAAALIAAGVGPGDRVAMWARNVPAWPVVQLGAAWAGAVLVTVNPSLSEEELTYVLDQSGSGLLLASPHRPDQAAMAERAARTGLAHEARRVVIIDSPGWAAFLAAGAAVPPRDVAAAAARVMPDDVAMLLYTSGTTGFPKGAMLTHRGMLRNAAAVGGNIRLGQGDRICLAVPFHHCFGSVMGTLAAVEYAATLVVPGDWFDAGDTLRAIERERCTVLYGVPTMFLAELDHPDRSRSNLASLRAGIIAGAPVPFDLAEQAARELHLPELVVAYGLTEASPVVTQTTPSDPPELRLGTVGRPIAGAEVRVVDESGRPVSPGEVGELVTRGPMVMRGYFDQDEETRAAIDTAGWLHTGDLATRDGRGYVRIVGRLKDMVIRGGENVYPAEIEAVGRRFPGVADVQVVGLPSDRLGEEVAAFVRVVPGSQLDEQALRAHFSANLAPFKVPRWILPAGEFPMTASGKVRKHELREQAIATLRGERRSPSMDAEDGGASTSAGPALPLLPPKHVVSADPSAVLETTPDPVRPGARLPSRPPRRGWRRPESPGWSWQHDDNPTRIPGTTAEDANVTLDNVRRRGQRIKTWGIGGNVREQIEATGELPIMYRALGTPPQTQHPFNLYGDIKSQPDALRGTFEAADEIAEVARRLNEHDPSGLIGLGSGTSQFVAQVANAAFARFAGLPGWDYDSLHFLRYPPEIDFRRFGAMAYSGSGSTVDTVAATKQSREAGAFTVAFTSVEGSPVVQASDARILTAGGFDTGGSDTFHYTTRVAAAIYLALELGKLRRPGAEDHDGLQRQLVDTARLMGEMFEAVDARCRTIAEQFLDVRSILVVGDGPNYGTAEEIALKFDEMAHIPTKPMNPGRHIHGALGLTEESILTVLVAPPGPSYRDMLSIAKVTQLLKTPAVAIVSEEDTEIADIVDYVVRLPMADETIFSVLAVLPGQLLPYWCGVGLGLNPDTQRSNVPKHARVWNMLFPPGTH